MTTRHFTVPLQPNKRLNLKRLMAWCATSVLATAAWTTSVAAAETFPDKPVKIVVNFPAGGPLDIIARLVAEKLQTTLKQPIIVENQTGAAGNIGARTVANAPADGYTILFSLDTPFTLSPSVYPSMPFEANALKPILMLGSSGLTLATHPSSGLDTLEKLIARGKAKSISFSSAGNGSPGHIAALMLAQATGIEVNHIPYRGNMPAVLALLSGEVDAGVLSTSGLLPQVTADKVKALAIVGSQRSPLLPNLPTIAELGYPQVELEFLFLAMLPAKTPEAVVKTLQESIGLALGQPDIQQRLATLDIVPSDMQVPQLTQRLSTLRERYAHLIKTAGFTLN